MNHKRDLHSRVSPARRTDPLFHDKASYLESRPPTGINSPFIQLEMKMKKKKKGGMLVDTLKAILIIIMTLLLKIINKPLSKQLEELSQYNHLDQSRWVLMVIHH